MVISDVLFVNTSTVKATPAAVFLPEKLPPLIESPRRKSAASLDNDVHGRYHGKHVCAGERLSLADADRHT
ncbi:MAG: hypothetical protein M1497_08680 [Nitrospirae bacterium]|nr:hypothetical protein [Nitrospirota bacterium]